MELKNKLKAWREDRGLSLEEAAVHIGCSSSALWNWESGNGAPKNKVMRARVNRILAAHERSSDEATA